MKKTLLIILACGILFCACISDKSEPQVSGFLFKTQFYNGDSAYQRDFLVYDYKGFSQIPLVTVNNETIGLYDQSINWYEYYDENRILTNKDYELKISHSGGSATAKIAMPNNFRIIGPDTNYIMDRDSSLLIIWQKSAKASWYWLDYYISYDYLDTAGEWDSYDFGKDTVLTDTFCRFAVGRFFPYYVVNILDGEGEANIWAMDGPKIYPGSKGNVSGQGIGFFNAANEGPDTYFYVGAPPAQRHLYKKDASREKIRNKLLSLRP
jgi:hypothetical protein